MDDDNEQYFAALDEEAFSASLWEHKKKTTRAKANRILVALPAGTSLEDQEQALREGLTSDEWQQWEEVCLDIGRELLSRGPLHV